MIDGEGSEQRLGDSDLLPWASSWSDEMPLSTGWAAPAGSPFLPAVTSLLSSEHGSAPVRSEIPERSQFRLREWVLNRSDDQEPAAWLDPCRGNLPERSQFRLRSNECPVAFVPRVDGSARRGCRRLSPNVPNFQAATGSVLNRSDVQGGPAGSAGSRRIPRTKPIQVAPGRARLGSDVGVDRFA